MQQKPTWSPKAADTLRMMPIEKLVQLIENWIKNKQENWFQEEEKRMAWSYFDVLNKRIQESWKNQTKWKPDSLRDRTISVLLKLKELSWDESQVVSDLLTSVWERTHRFLVNYGFTRCNSISELEDFLNLPEQWRETWNDLKFHAFLTHLFSLNKIYDSAKAEFLVSFFELDSIKSCEWTEVNLWEFAKIIKKLKDKNVKAQLKRTFNKLPWVQKVRRLWNVKDKNDIWNTLHYEQDANHWWEARWYSRSKIWEMPAQMWPLAISRW